MMRPHVLAFPFVVVTAVALAGACDEPLAVSPADNIPNPDDGSFGDEGEGEGAEGEGEGEGVDPFARCEDSSATVVADDIVRTTNGLVRGERVDGTWRFRGIRYAAPPTGERRFAAPQDPECNEGVVNALDYGNACPQFGPSFDVVTGDEDCLFLNVWSPALENEVSDGGERPVMFFIHGGGNILGESSQSLIVDDLYDGQALAEETGNVVVTINYRLGALGFLAHPALTERDGTSGNAGIRDAIKALEWVRDNIGGFGGDASRVMVFGESAGALNTCALVASPLAAGLFSSALMESGACLAPPLATREEQGIAATGCEDLACLLEKSPEDLVRALAPIPQVVQTWSLTWGLTTDGDVLPDAPLEMMARGEHNHVPFTVGSNREEMNFFIPLTVVNTCLDMTIALEALAGDHADAVREMYPCFDEGFPHETFIAVATDLVFTCPARRVARAVAAHQTQPVFRYHFRDRANTGPTALLGAYHASELFFVFDKLEAQPGYFSSDGEKDLTRQMQRYWGRLAEHGDPNGAGEQQWPRYDVARDNFLVLDEEPFEGMALSVDEKLQAEQCDLWDEIAFQ
jgi:para-nitrobenzyl esterase